MEIGKTQDSDDEHSLSSRVGRLRQITEETERDTSDVIVLDPDSYSEVATGKRREIIQELRENSYDSKKELADKLDRDPKNVHEDLEILRKNGVVKLEKNGRKISPTLKHRQIVGEKL